ncbi:unnamed protein product [Strongylus vulgaris]|uniref:Uncharacterized protein n=1 Tax=Strongylus vulgaris TaxID=40348 RepID=A0A3P7JHE4_STRVU|nr:unnamed protein product [Strongylus vulgaris]
MTTFLLQVLALFLIVNIAAPQRSTSEDSDEFTPRVPPRTTTSSDSDEFTSRPVRTTTRTSPRTTTSSESDEFTSRDPRTTTAGVFCKQYFLRFIDFSFQQTGAITSAADQMRSAFS